MLQFAAVCAIFVISTAAVVDGKMDIVHMHVPEYVARGRDVRLACQYTSNSGTLYVVRWYKDSHEFYRYVPRNKPPQKTFKQPGFVIDVDRSDESAVQLVHLTPEASGTYTCEVITESPEFYTDFRKHNMTVVELPENRPTITSRSSWYAPGDVMNVSCRSGPALPAPTLTWYINSERVPPHLTQRQHITPNDYLQTTTIQLLAQVRATFFRDGILRLKCTAALGDLYWQSSEMLIREQDDSSNSEPNTAQTQHGAPVMILGSVCIVLGLLPP